MTGTRTKAADRYDNTSKTCSPEAKKALDDLIRNGVTSAPVGSGADEARRGQAWGEAGGTAATDEQEAERRRRLMEKRRALEEERDRVNEAYDRELKLNAQELDRCTIMGL